MNTRTSKTGKVCAGPLTQDRAAFTILEKARDRRPPPAESEEHMTTRTPEQTADHQARQALKIQPVDFRVTWTESPDQSVTERVATSWAEFAGILGRLKAGAPHGGAYHKTGFQITFADGSTYTGRYDVENISRRQVGISEHVRRHVGYASGLVKPAHLTETDYAGHLNAIGLEHQARMYFIARDYAVGVDTPEDKQPEPELHSESCEVEPWEACPECVAEADPHPDAVADQDPDDGSPGSRYAYTVEPGFTRYTVDEFEQAEADAYGKSEAERFGLAVIHNADGEIVARYRNGEKVEPFIWSDRGGWYPTEEARRMVGAAEAHTPGSYHVVITDPAGHETEGHDIRDRTTAHNRRRELAENYAGSEYRVEVRRADGTPDPDPSSEPIEPDLFAGIPADSASAEQIAAGLQQAEPEERRALVFTEKGKGQLARLIAEAEARKAAELAQRLRYPDPDSPLELDEYARAYGDGHERRAPAEVRRVPAVYDQGYIDGMKASAGVTWQAEHGTPEPAEPTAEDLRPAIRYVESTPAEYVARELVKRAATIEHLRGRIAR